MTSSLLPVFFEENQKGPFSISKPSEKTVKIKAEITLNETNIDQWDALFKVFQEQIDVNYDPAHPEKITADLKAEVHDAFQALLSRFPYLTDYWRTWSILEFKLNGVEASIKILEKSVANHPYSVDLWVDYLSALISQYGVGEGDESSEKLKFIRYQYHQAIELNGHHFTSHALWDKAIEFESSIQSTSPELLRLYTQVIKIPLYQYAQYYKQFVDINKNYKVVDILNEAELDTYLKKFGKESAKEFSLIEKHQIIDDYSYNVFIKTQQEVNIKWPFESAIFLHNFDIKALENKSTIATEVENWIKYLDHEIRQYKIDNNAFEGIVNLFQRALIPHCFNIKIWLKYIAFLNISSQPENSKLELMKVAYNRANSTFIPLDETSVRFNYVKFLMKHKEFNSANEHLLYLISFYSGSRNHKTGYMKKQYIESVTEILALWKKHLPPAEYKTTITKIITDHFDHRVKKEATKLESKLLEQHNVDILLKNLNDEGICVAIKAYLISLDYTEEGVASARKFFNKYHKESALKSSTFFWKHFLELEGIASQNISNFLIVLNYVKTKTQLPKAVLDGMIDLGYDIVSANLSSINSDELVMRDNNLSNSLVENVTARKRLGENISLTKSSEIPSKQLNSSFAKDDETLKVLRKHIGTPGIFAEATPDITNKFMNEGNWLDLDRPRLLVPPFPTFKNVEKAALPVRYPGE